MTGHPLVMPTHPPVDRLEDLSRILNVGAPESQTDEGYCVLLKDPGAVDRLETELVLASQMRSLGHVHRVLAHDLKAPLNSMQLSLELLADSIASDDAAAAPAAKDRRQRHVSILREELARLDRLLRDTLEPREPSAPAPATFDLRDVMREIRRLLLPLARRHRVDLDIQVPDAALAVAGHGQRIRQALFNLAMRGVAALADGGRLTVELKPQGQLAVVTLQLDGARVADSPTGAGGLDLYVTRLVVESHGGKMVEELAPGAGTRFRLTLPLAWPAL
jgi:two-component system NtrC family sensor kinase